jgi:hypothetical protein
MSAAIATAAAAVEAKEIYRICAEWDTAADADRVRAKAFFSRFITYRFKMACVPSEEDCPVPFVTVYIQSEARNRVTDWLEIQATGAIGVVFDEYTDPNKPAVGVISDVCDEFNESAGLEFAEDDEEEDDAESKGSGDEVDASPLD